MINTNERPLEYQDYTPRPGLGLIVMGIVLFCLSLFVAFFLYMRSHARDSQFSNLNCTESGISYHMWNAKDGIPHDQYVQMCKIKESSSSVPDGLFIFLLVFIPAIGIVMTIIGARKYAWHKKVMKLDNQTPEEREKEKQKDLANDKKEINYWDMS